MFLSLIQGVINKKTDIALNDLALKAKAGDEEVMNDLLFAHAQFMKKTASFVCNRFIDEHDDEYSVAMSGFHEAILKFKPNKNASFTTFAHLIIKRRLIDYIRKEIVRNEELFQEDNERNRYLDSTSIEIHSQESHASDQREEMIRFNELLKNYGLSFDELSRTSPKHENTRKTAFQIAQIIAETPEFYEHVISKKRIPIKELEDLVEVSRKTIERQRKYILAVVLLLGSDFYYIKEYVKGEII